MNSEPRHADGNEWDADVRGQPGIDSQDGRALGNSGPAVGAQAGEVVRLRPRIDRAAALKPARDAQREPVRHVFFAAEGRCIVLDVAGRVPAAEGRSSEDGVPSATAISYFFYSGPEDR